MEMIIVLGILSVVLSTVFTVLITFQSTYHKTSREFGEVTEKALGERAVWLSLINAGPSFNNMNQPDDLGREFFDLLPDYSSKLINPAINRQRTLTLNNTGETAAFLLFDKQAYPPVYYDSVRAYNITQPATVDAAGSMAYNNLNKDGYMNILNPVLYRNNNMLMLYSPIGLRPPGAPMTTPPKFTIFTGRVTGGGFAADTAGIIRNTHPATGAVLADPDQFFRNAPAMGSANQMVLVAGVTLIRYVLQKSTTTLNCMLVRQVWNGQAWAQTTPIALGVTEVKFKRESISVATVSSEMKFDFYKVPEVAPCR